MTDYDFECWVLKNCPEGVDVDDFINILAIGTIQLIEHVHQKEKMPLKSLVGLFFDKAGH